MEAVSSRKRRCAATGPLGQTSSPPVPAALLLTVSRPFLQAAEVEKFFQEHPVPLASRKISQMLENTRINAKWLETMKQGKLGDDGFFVLIMMTMDMA